MIKLLLAGTAMACLCVSFTKEKPFTPPGTVQINDTLFADEAEITNFAWLEYIWWNASIYGNDSKEYKSCLPDTLVWKEKSTYNAPYTQYYFRHEAYRDYPVVGISYDQAVNFCKWRTNQVKMFLTRKKDFKNHNFEYRLPSKEEWEQLAYSSSSVLYSNGKNEKGKYSLNCINLDTATVNGPPYPDVTVSVYSYSKNFIGLYNMLGNVAEMINEKGVSKGGSWRNRIEECRVGKEIEYSRPTAWLGFRCVCVVKKEYN